MRRLFLLLAFVLVVSPIWSVPGAAHQQATTLPLEANPLATAAGQASGVAGYYRFPEIHGDTIVFAAEGDLWITTVDGGVAQRITTHPSEETDPVISPDGMTLAFTARYEGPAELYTMPLAGGVPTPANV